MHVKVMSDSRPTALATVIRAFCVLVRLPSPRAVRTAIERLIWSFSLAFGPSFDGERMSMGVDAGRGAAAGPRSAAIGRD